MNLDSLLYPRAGTTRRNLQTIVNTCDRLRSLTINMTFASSSGVESGSSGSSGASRHSFNSCKHSWNLVTRQSSIFQILEQINSWPKIPDSKPSSLFTLQKSIRIMRDSNELPRNRRMKIEEGSLLEFRDDNQQSLRELEMSTKTSLPFQLSLRDRGSKSIQSIPNFSPKEALTLSLSNQPTVLGLL